MKTYVKRLKEYEKIDFDSTKIIAGIARIKKGNLSSKAKQLLWALHDRIRAKTEALDGNTIKSAVNKSVKEVRGAKKTRRRS